MDNMMLNETNLQAENNRLKARLETLRIIGSLPPHLRNTRQVSDASALAGDDSTSTHTPNYALNAWRDTFYSHDRPEFEKVLHIFHLEYAGIRAAAGSLPGAKLGITASASLTNASIGQLIERLAEKNYTRIILHGYSANMQNLAKTLRTVFSAEIFGVWHGNFGQLIYVDERRAFDLWLGDQTNGLISRAHILKKNSSDILPRGYNKLLLNMPPRLRDARSTTPFSSAEGVIAFIPSWPDVRKNIISNYLAAINNPYVQKIFHYAPMTSPQAHTKQTIQAKYSERDHFQILQTIDVVLNATLIDCHPMVDVEALACGTPSITSRLFLEGVDNHPYSNLTSVENPLDHTEISRVITNLNGMHSQELSELMSDYSQLLQELSIQRYADFVRL